MAITRERFQQGISYEAYKAQMTCNREWLEETEQTLALPATDVQVFSQLEQPLHVVVLTGDWCGAAIENIPVLARLAADSGKLHVRFFLRDQNLDLMNQYLKDGVHRTIPTFVFFDHAFRELGRWYEGPAKIRELESRLRREFFATDPALAGLSLETPFRQLPEAARLRLIQAFDGLRTETRELSDREVVREIREIVERGLATDG